MLVMEVVRARQLKSPASGTPLCKAEHKNGMLTLGDFVSARPHAPVIASLLARSNSMFLYCFSATCIPIFALVQGTGIL